MLVAQRSVLSERSGRTRGRFSAFMIELLALDLTFLSDTWSFVEDNFDELVAGLRRTIQVSVIAIAGAFVIGLVLGAARAHRMPVVSQLAAMYVEVIRNTPILVQIFFLYYGLTQGIGPPGPPRRASPSPGSP